MTIKHTRTLLKMLKKCKMSKMRSEILKILHKFMPKVLVVLVVKTQNHLLNQEIISL